MASVPCSLPPFIKNETQKQTLIKLQDQGQTITRDLFRRPKKTIEMLCRHMIDLFFIFFLKQADPVLCSLF